MSLDCDCDQSGKKEILRIGGRSGGIGTAKFENELAVGTEELPTEW
jgi:hypothetical protein